MRLATLLVDDSQIVVGVDVSEGTARFVDLKAIDPALPNTMREILVEPTGLQRAEKAFQKGVAESSFVTGKLLAPVPDPGKVICIGLNYRDHAEETGAAIPTEPVCFGKFSSAIIGPEETILLPKVSHRVDYEAELVVVIGKTGKNIPRESAFDYVAGYMIGHDVSARDWQKGRPAGQWLLGKTPDTFAPTGPWLTTADEVVDPHQLDVSLFLNDEQLQDGNTREFIFKIDELIAHVSQLVTLSPGDVIFTGTPPGVGDARTPPVYLKDGDKVRIVIDGLGELRNSVRQEV
ncbi:fumarylacetoacetate hydrolase family protein [Calycomorphotria hydatis]|uniref:Ureidoglycolate lyase n=1 Tax=Calycomorphotria hydatis TaxID=2528027 RepID=A0A517T8V4_9PLAN|nr:fumarylacetoacetate hydrolase family protein [Calycomorphotria hydatis]QDT64797.1 Ureidoglycolate lyase [Calycomorphotria hydatis]